MADKKEQTKPVENPPPKSSSTNPDYKPIGSTSRIENGESPKTVSRQTIDTSDNS
jgi:hypothetical protein